MNPSISPPRVGSTSEARYERGARFRLRLATAFLVRLLHIAVVLVVVVAALLPLPSLWWAMIAVAPTMHLQWRINSNRCVLTDLERVLHGKDPHAASSADESFIGPLLEPILGELSEAKVDALCYGVLWCSFAGCLLRLALA